ncbi:MAG: alpha/beta hydrolase [Allorhizobium sp.]
MLHHIEDWTDAYSNGPNIPGGDRWPDLWVAPARDYRTALLAAGRAELDLAYGPGERSKLDIFLPEGAPKGLVVFVHGGFWLRLDRTFWSNLAAGPVAHGYAVAIPSYTLCPDIRVAGITREIGHAIAYAAGRIGGPIRLTGHSAGGHLVTRMVSSTSPLPSEIAARVVNIVSIAGLHDLRPLLTIGMNAQIGLDAEEAALESPALLAPRPGTRLTCWVGANERSEFIRQNALLANIWKGLGAATDCVEQPDRHHFNVVDGLTDPRHPLTVALMQD